MIEKALSHWSHLYVLSPECVLMWRDRPADYVKALSHTDYIWRVSLHNVFPYEPVRLEFWAKSISNMLHWKDFSPVCVLIWHGRSLYCMHYLINWSHLNGLSPKCLHMACQYLNGLSPGCVFIWREGPAGCAKALSYWLHLLNRLFLHIYPVMIPSLSLKSANILRPSANPWYNYSIAELSL